MYIEHQLFIQPTNEDIKVWRFMDFTKMVSLIDSTMLYFTRADSFEDQFEGSSPKINIENRKHLLEGLTPEEYKRNKRHDEEYISFFSALPATTALNCWHMSEHESALWKLYLRSDEGIAIQSTYSKLKNSLIDEEDVYLGKVTYIDYDKETFEEGNIFTPFVHKRINFAHEKEARALVTKFPPTKDNPEPIKDGLKIRIDIETLIESIYLAPNSPSWFADLVKAVILKYGYEFEVVQSKLDESPIF